MMFRKVVFTNQVQPRDVAQYLNGESIDAEKGSVLADINENSIPDWGNHLRKCTIDLINPVEQQQSEQGEQPQKKARNDRNGRGRKNFSHRSAGAAGKPRNANSSVAVFDDDYSSDGSEFCTVSRVDGARSCSNADVSTTTSRERKSMPNGRSNKQFPQPTAQSTPQPPRNQRRNHEKKGLVLNDFLPHDNNSPSGNGRSNDFVSRDKNSPSGNGRSRKKKGKWSNENTSPRHHNTSESFGYNGSQSSEDFPSLMSTSGLSSSPGASVTLGAGSRNGSWSSPGLGVNSSLSSTGTPGTGPPSQNRVGRTKRMGIPNQGAPRRIELRADLESSQENLDASFGTGNEWKSIASTPAQAISVVNSNRSGDNSCPDSNRKRGGHAKSAYDSQSEADLRAGRVGRPKRMGIPNQGAPCRIDIRTDLESSQENLDASFGTGNEWKSIASTPAQAISVVNSNRSGDNSCPDSNRKRGGHAKSACGSQFEEELGTGRVGRSKRMGIPNQGAPSRIDIRTDLESSQENLDPSPGTGNEWNNSVTSTPAQATSVVNSNRSRNNSCPDSNRKRGGHTKSACDSQSEAELRAAGDGGCPQTNSLGPEVHKEPPLEDLPSSLLVDFDGKNMDMAALKISSANGVGEQDSASDPQSGDCSTKQLSSPVEQNGPSHDGKTGKAERDAGKGSPLHSCEKDGKEGHALQGEIIYPMDKELPPVPSLPQGVTHKRELNLVVDLHSELLDAQLLPSLSTETYFIGQLFTVPDQHCFPPYIDDKLPIEDRNYFYSTHNAVYFAVTFMQKQKELFKALDKPTLMLLSENQRLQDFCPEFQQELKDFCATVEDPPPCVKRSQPLFQWTFRPATDCKKNFDTQKNFMKVKTMRDNFPLIMEKWTMRKIKLWDPEETHDMIQDLFKNTDPTCCMHFARLFITHFNEACKEENEKGPADTIKNYSAWEQDLEQRMVFSIGPNPPPIFPGFQEFFVYFIKTANNSMFNTYLKDVLITNIHRMNTTKFKATGTKSEMANDQAEEEEVEDGGDPSEVGLGAETFREYVLTLKAYARLLGLLTFDSYKNCQNFPHTLFDEMISQRHSTPLPLDLRGYLHRAIEEDTLALTVPWIAEFLAMMDDGAPCLDTIRPVLADLHRLLRLTGQQLKRRGYPFDQLLVVTTLGWLFEQSPLLGYYYRGDRDVVSSIETMPKIEKMKQLVTRHFFSQCCPYFGNIRVLLCYLNDGRHPPSFPRKPNLRPVASVAPNRVKLPQNKENDECQFALMTCVYNHALPKSIMESVELVTKTNFDNLKSFMGSAILTPVLGTFANGDFMMSNVPETSHDLWKEIHKEIHKNSHSFYEKQRSLVRLLMPEHLPDEMKDLMVDISVIKLKKLFEKWMRNEVWTLEGNFYKKLCDSVQKNAGDMYQENMEPKRPFDWENCCKPPFTGQDRSVVFVPRPSDGTQNRSVLESLGTLEFYDKNKKFVSTEKGRLIVYVKGSDGNYHRRESCDPEDDKMISPSRTETTDASARDVTQSEENKSGSDPKTLRMEKQSVETEGSACSPVHNRSRNKDGSALEQEVLRTKEENSETEGGACAAADNCCSDEKRSVLEQKVIQTKKQNSQSEGGASTAANSCSCDRNRSESVEKSHVVLQQDESSTGGSAQYTVGQKQNRHKKKGCASRQAPTANSSPGDTRVTNSGDSLAVSACSDPKPSLKSVTQTSAATTPPPSGDAQGGAATADAGNVPADAGDAPERVIGAENNCLTAAAANNEQAEAMAVIEELKAALESRLEYGVLVYISRELQDLLYYMNISGKQDRRELDIFMILLQKHSAGREFVLKTLLRKTIVFLENYEEMNEIVLRDIFHDLEYLAVAIVFREPGLWTAEISDLFDKAWACPGIKSFEFDMVCGVVKLRHIDEAPNLWLSLELYAKFLKRLMNEGRLNGVRAKFGEPNALNYTIPGDQYLLEVLHYLENNVDEKTFWQQAKSGFRDKYQARATVMA